MAIVNRTPDSFYDHGATYAEAAALDRVAQVVAEGADIVDIGGVKAGYGDDVDAAEELRRTAAFVERVRSAYPDLVISVDTWRAEVGPRALQRGADLLNDTWAGADPEIAEVAAEFGVGLVCSHTGGLGPRTDPHRPAYDDVVADVVAAVTGLAERAVVARGAARRHPDRPDPRLRQEHLPLAGADPAARRARRDRLAGAGGAVQQGLHRRDAGPPDRRAARRARWPRLPSRPGTERGCSARTRSPRPGRCSTWSPRSRASGHPRAPSAASPSEPSGTSRRTVQKFPPNRPEVPAVIETGCPASDDRSRSPRAATPNDAGPGTPASASRVSPGVPAPERVFFCFAMAGLSRDGAA